MNLEYIKFYLANIWMSIVNPKMWMILTAIAAFINQYIFSEWNFAISFFIIFIMDTVSGSYIAWKTKCFDNKIFRDKLMDKCIAYFTIIISVSAGSKMILEGSDTNLISYINLPFYTLFITVEIKSIISKWYEYKRWYWLGVLLEWINKRKKDNIDAINSKL